ncbi:MULTISPECIES: hypothetical protein [Mesobacillus]|uniref:Uncharacterized protein n=2 Tax=Mesobacillus TaxID=2675231 RepID=A0A0D6ZEV0_9BACI|nr:MULTISPECIES: hypothetical protein [Mesobacillus]KIY23143.1 hypothetical protein UB32_04650 [Mesobacillus subterraneus]MDQ0415686.1 hypothetical protein [Mesobacillus stamsii]
MKSLIKLDKIQSGSYLTNEIVKLKNQLYAFEERQEKAAKYLTELEWLSNELKDMPEFDPLKHLIAFRADIFE